MLVLVVIFIFRNLRAIWWNIAAPTTSEPTHNQVIMVVKLNPQSSYYGSKKEYGLMEAV